MSSESRRKKTDLLYSEQTKDYHSLQNQMKRYRRMVDIHRAYDKIKEAFDIIMYMNIDDTYNTYESFEATLEWFQQWLDSVKHYKMWKGHEMKEHFDEDEFVILK